MRNELTLRINPARPELVRQIKQLLKKDYRILESIDQLVNGESYLYLQLETKDAHPRSTPKQ